MNTAGYDSKYAALYYPWIEVMDPLTNRPIEVPPSGTWPACGAAPTRPAACTRRPPTRSSSAPTAWPSRSRTTEQGGLNQIGINCIRAFPGRGIRIWGARTLSSDPEWRYINVRRLFNYISESIVEGTQWGVFEPNDDRLWMRLRISAANFLTRVWRDGRAFGATPEQAFFVKCDAETNPPDVIEAGQVVIEIGIAPVKPAEFVIFRLSQFTAARRRGRGVARSSLRGNEEGLRCLKEAPKRFPTGIIARGTAIGMFRECSGSTSETAIEQCLGRAGRRTAARPASRCRSAT